MNTLKVLIVDDEPGIRSGVSRILRNFTLSFPFVDDDFDFETIEVETGEEGLNKIEAGEADIVLLDNKLPGIEGIEVLEKIKEKNYDVAVMMITSYASLDIAVKATNYGAYNFVPKPFTPSELKTEMESITKHLYLKRMTSKMQVDAKKIRFQFLSVLSHELKSPINAVEGYLKIIKDRQVGDKLENYDTMIDRSLERIKGMRSLILDLLDLTKIESGTKERKISRIDINELIVSCIDSIEPLAIQKNIKVHFQAVNSISYKAEEQEIRIILNNLLSNAVKYNVEDGNIYVDAEIKDSNLVISVEDTGIGISQEDMDKLFTEFTRIKNAKTRSISGSGLGLSITKKIVDTYEGNIKAESSPDKGSKFVVSLPL